MAKAVSAAIRLTGLLFPARQYRLRMVGAGAYVIIACAVKEVNNGHQAAGNSDFKT
jgi:hypothetical protein